MADTSVNLSETPPSSAADTSASSSKHGIPAKHETKSVITFSKKTPFKTAVNTILILLYLWFCIFLFPAMHDLFHELGHASYALHHCGSTHIQITLGETTEEPCEPPDQQKTILEICVKPQWLINSLNRESVTFHDECNDIGISMISGVSGLIFSWVFMFFVVLISWKLWVRRGWNESLLCASLYLFAPFYFLSLLEMGSWLVNAVVGFGALIIQIDLINGFFYVFLPSRLITWEYIETGDGTKAWLALGYSPETISKISYFTFFLLLLVYIVIIGLYIRFLMQSRNSVLFKDSKEQDIENGKFTDSDETTNSKTNSEY